MFFKRNKKNKLNLNDHKWSVGETTMNDLPFFIRFNTTINTPQYREAFPIKVGFAVQFNSKNDLGLPIDKEVQELNVIEDTIIDLIAEQGVQALSLTTGGIREFIFYVMQGTDIASIHQPLLSDIKSHDVQCMATSEPNWDTYDEYTPS